MLYSFSLFISPFRYVQAGLSPAEASRLTIALRYVELLPAVLQVI
jgi:hypothetical protein